MKKVCAKLSMPVFWFALFTESTDKRLFKNSRMDLLFNQQATRWPWFWSIRDVLSLAVRGHATKQKKKNKKNEEKTYKIFILLIFVIGIHGNWFPVFITMVPIVCNRWNRWSYRFLLSSNRMEPNQWQWLYDTRDFVCRSAYRDLDWSCKFCFLNSAFCIIKFYRDSTCKIENNNLFTMTERTMNRFEFKKRVY